MPEKKKKVAEEAEETVDYVNEAEIEEETENTESPGCPEEKDELTALREELESYKDLAFRTAAEFDNFKKRTLREKESLTEYVKVSTFKALMPAYDSLDRSLAADSESAEYVKGIELTVKQLVEAFAKLGVAEIEAQGAPFDPNLHEAIMHVEDEGLPEATVAEVIQKGYILGNTVIRPAIVKVAN